MTTNEVVKERRRRRSKERHEKSLETGERKLHLMKYLQLVRMNPYIEEVNTKNFMLNNSQRKQVSDL